MNSKSQATTQSQHRCTVIPLNLETRFAVTTAEAATHLNRAQQTLRIWACYENGPILPIRINGRLAWRVADLRALLEGSQP